MPPNGLSHPAAGAVYHLDPWDALIIVTSTLHPAAGPHDIVDKTHPLCEEAERPVLESEIEYAEDYGILQPIRAVKDGDDRAIVVVGRRRTRMMREVNRRRVAYNEARHGYEAEKPPGVVPTVLLKAAASLESTEGRLFVRGVMLAENMQRVDYSPMQKARALAEYIRLGATPEMAAVTFGEKTAWVQQNLAVLDCAEEIHRALESGGCSVTAAAELAKLPRAEQVTRLTELLAAGGATVARTKRAVKAAKLGQQTDDVSAKPRARLVTASLRALEEKLEDNRLGEEKRALYLGAKFAIQWMRTGVDGAPLLKLSDMAEAWLKDGIKDDKKKEE